MKSKSPTKVIILGDFYFFITRYAMGAKALMKLNDIGQRLLTELCMGRGVEAVRGLTEVQVEKILSFQNKLSLSEDGRYKLSDKGKGGGYLDIKKFESRFFR